jgi:recombination protein RecT
MDPVVKPENQVAFVEKTIADKVMSRVRALEEQKRVVIPPNYSAENALQSAYLILQGVTDKEGNNALSVCTPDSVANALFDMVVQGLNPQKKQCYFIARGKKLCLDRSYFGDQVVIKRAVPGITDVFANVIYKGDNVELIQEPSGRIFVKSHETKFENRDNDIIGAYSVIIKDGVAHFEIMTWKEIQMSWSKRSNNGQVQKDFPQEMAKRTVIRRGVKNFINSSDDSNLDITESYNRTTNDEFGDTGEVVEVVKQEVVDKTAKVDAPELTPSGNVQDETPHVDPVPEGQTTLFEQPKQEEPKHKRPSL